MNGVRCSAMARMPMVRLASRPRSRMPWPSGWLAKLRATNTGVTAIIDQRGVVQARLPDFREGVLNGQAQGYSGATLYVRCGNWIAVMAAVLLLAGALAARRARRILLARSATEAAGR